MIKVDVISGFLGAGKTTLIKKMYAHAFQNEKVVLIENEFGKVGIDGAFLRDAGIEIKEINSGCICCTLVGDFNKSLEEIITRFAPQRIIIEPSGVGKLSDIIESIHKFGDSLTLNIVATVVNAGKCKMYMRNFGEFYVDQIKQANTIILSMADVLPPDKIQDSIELVRGLNAHANIVSTPIAALDSAQLLAVLEQDVSLMDILMGEVREAAKHHHHHHHHHHDDEDEHCHCHHHDDEDDEEHEHHHHDDEDKHCHCHHHDDEDDEEHEHHHHDEEHEHHHGHDADEVFDSWGKETSRAYTYAQLDGILQQLCTPRYGVVLRSKGIVPATDNGNWYYFDLVAGDYEIRLGAPDIIGRLCVIGANLDAAALTELFAL